MSKTSPEMDAVVMWVNGEEPRFVQEFDRERRSYFADKDPSKYWSINSKGRHRDNGELRYCLRGIEMNIPFIRKIFVVTNGQRPDFIDFSSPRIDLVTHDQLFDTDCLPNFNTFAIESVLHNIPGISNNFIRFSDDHFICKPMAEVDFAGNDGEGRYYFKGKVALPSEGRNPYQEQLAKNAMRLYRDSQFYPAFNYIHGPQFRRVDRYSEFEAWAGSNIASTRLAKFRCKADLISLFMYPHYVAAKIKRAKVSAKNGTYSHPDLIYPGKKLYEQIAANQAEPRAWRDRLEVIMEEPPYFLNINDGLGNNPECEDVDAIQRSLNAVFPDAASFER